MMAMKSARLAARLIGETDQARRPGLSTARQRFYTARVGRMMMVYIKMITAFYDNPSFELFMHPAPVMKIPSAIVAIVGGGDRAAISIVVADEGVLFSLLAAAAFWNSAAD